MPNPDVVNSVRRYRSCVRLYSNSCDVLDGLTGRASRIDGFGFRLHVGSDSFDVTWDEVTDAEDGRYA